MSQGFSNAAEVFWIGFWRCLKAGMSQTLVMRDLFLSSLGFLGSVEIPLVEALCATLSHGEQALKALMQGFCNDVCLEMHTLAIHRANSAKNSKKLEALPGLDPCHRNFLLHQSVVQFAGWLTGRQAASLNGWSINIELGSVMKVIIIDVVLFSTTLLLPAFLSTLESFFSGGFRVF